MACCQAGFGLTTGAAAGINGSGPTMPGGEPAAFALDNPGLDNPGPGASFPALPPRAGFVPASTGRADPRPGTAGLRSDTAGASGTAVGIDASMRRTASERIASAPCHSVRPVRISY